MKIEPSVFTDASLVDGRLVFNKDLRQHKEEQFDFNRLRLGRYSLREMPDHDPSSKFIYLNGKKMAAITIIDGRNLNNSTSIECRWYGFMASNNDVLHGSFFMDHIIQISDYIRSFLAKIPK